MKRVQYRVASASEFTSKNPILARDEIGIEKDTGREKIGDGSTAWTGLSYFPDAAFADSDIEITSSSKGLILKASDGSRYRVTVHPDGSLITTAL